ncbi:hypothetical protein L523_0474 [Bordetella bronchiseptica MBORD731]|nr:hypothetical protein L523_0474 [Bordetella bronchiseptica MBORD731]
MTHRDLHPLEDAVAAKLRAEFGRRGANTEIVNIAPFSDNPDVPPGFGIAELIDKTVDAPLEQPIFWQSTEPVDDDRAYLSYRRDR